MNKNFDEMNLNEKALDTLAYCNLWSDEDRSMFEGMSESQIYKVLQDYNKHIDNQMTHIRERAKAVYQFINDEL
jgi:hypothetical protein